MKKFIWIILILIIGGGTWFFVTKDDGDKQISVTAEPPHTGYISNAVTATGTIEPVDTVAVGAQISGTIQNIYADFNSTVKKGQLIATLDKSLFTDQVNQNMGNLQNAESNLQFQQQNFNRQTQLFNAGAISRADYETAQATYNTAVAQVKSARAVLAASERNLSFTNIYSPIDGTVLTRNVSEGQTVASSFNTPMLFSIAKDLRKMQVRASVDEADIGNVKKGQEVSFTVDAFPDNTFEGIVDEVRLQPIVTANVVTYTTIIDAENDELKLKPGMTANVTIFLQQDSTATLIPAKALTFEPDSALARQYQIVTNEAGNENITPDEKRSSFPPEVQSVWVLNGTKIIKKNILTGMNDNINVQILGGLSAGEKVIDGTEEGSSVKKTSPEERSPFMPSRRRQQPKKKG